MRRRQIQNIVGDQPIVEEEVGALDHPQRLHRQQLRVTGPRPDQEHVPGPPPPLPRPLAAPLLLQNPQQPLQLRQLERNVAVPGRIGAGVGRDGARREMGVVLVQPAIPPVPLGGVPLGEGGRRRSTEAWEGEHSRSQRGRRGRGEEGGVGGGSGSELPREESHGEGELVGVESLSNHIYVRMLGRCASLFGEEEEATGKEQWVALGWKGKPSSMNLPTCFWRKFLARHPQLGKN